MMIIDMYVCYICLDDLMEGRGVSRRTNIHMLMVDATIGNDLI